MSPGRGNRVNPGTTNSEGKFGWDTASGFYEVTASKSGCGSASTAAFEVPPAQTELLLVLHCETPLQVETTTLPGATVGVPYKATLEASGGKPPYKWKQRPPSCRKG